MNNFNFVKIDSSNKYLYDDFVNTTSYSGFFHTSEWIEFQKSYGKKWEQFVVVSKESKIVGVFAINLNYRKLTKYGYLPGFPLLSDDVNIEEFFKELKLFLEIYRDENSLHTVRFDSVQQGCTESNFTKSGFVKSLAPGLPRFWWELDLSQSLEDIRSGMSKSTRYNVNKTQREGLKFAEVTNENEVEEFFKVIQETTERKGFYNFDLDFFEKQFRLLYPLGMCRIFLAKYEDKYISGALVNIYKNKAWYTHGASTSDRELSKLRSPYFLQWEIMKLMKESGIKKYNMWGVVSEKQEIKNKKHALQGVSEFKKSFGGYMIETLPVYEVGSNGLNYYINRAYDWWTYRNDRY